MLEKVQYSTTIKKRFSLFTVQLKSPMLVEYNFYKFTSIIQNTAQMIDQNYQSNFSTDSPMAYFLLYAFNCNKTGSDPPQ